MANMVNKKSSIVSKLCLLACVTALHTTEVYAQIASSESDAGKGTFAASNMNANPIDTRDVFSEIPDFDTVDDEARAFAASQPSAGDIEDAATMVEIPEFDEVEGDDYVATDIGGDSDQEIEAITVEALSGEGEVDGDYAGFDDGNDQEIEALISEGNGDVTGGDLNDTAEATGGVSDILNSDVEVPPAPPVAQQITTEELIDNQRAGAVPPPPPPPTPTIITVEAMQDEEVDIEQQLFELQAKDTKKTKTTSILDALNITSDGDYDLPEQSDDDAIMSDTGDVIPDAGTAEIPGFLLAREFTGDNSHIPAVILSNEIDRLFVASVAKGDVKRVRILLESGRSPNVANKYGVTPLIAAVNKNDVRMTRYLLAKGAKASLSNKHGVSPLHVAIDRKNTEMVKVLLRSGAKVDVRTKTGLTPLMSAVNQNNQDMVEMLVDAGADLNGQNKEGYSALHMAAYNGNVGLVNYLLDKKASPMAVNVAGMTAADLSRLRNNSEVYDVIAKAINVAEEKQHMLAMKRLQTPLKMPTESYALMDIDEKNKWDGHFREWIEADKKFASLSDEEKRLWNKRRLVLAKVFASQFSSDEEEERVAIANHLQKWEDIAPAVKVVAVAAPITQRAARTIDPREIDAAVEQEIAAAQIEVLDDDLYVPDGLSEITENDVTRALEAEGDDVEPVNGYSSTFKEGELIDTMSRFEDIVANYEKYDEKQKEAAEKESEMLLSMIENKYAQDFAALPDVLKNDFIATIEQWMAKASLSTTEFAEQEYIEVEPTENADEEFISIEEADAGESSVMSKQEEEMLSLLNDEDAETVVVVGENEKSATSGTFKEGIASIDAQIAQQRRDMMEDVLGVEDENELVETPESFDDMAEIPSAEVKPSMEEVEVVDIDTAVFDEEEIIESDAAKAQDAEAAKLAMKTPEEIMAEEGLGELDIPPAPEVNVSEVVEVVEEESDFPEDENAEIVNIIHGDEHTYIDDEEEIVESDATKAQDAEAAKLAMKTPEEIMAEEGFVDETMAESESEVLGDEEEIIVLSEDEGDFSEEEEAEIVGVMDEGTNDEEMVDEESVEVSDVVDTVEEETEIVATENIEDIQPVTSEEATNSAEIDDFSIPSVSAMIDEGKTIIDDGSAESKLPWLTQAQKAPAVDYTTDEVDSIMKLITRIKKSPGELDEMRRLAEEQLRLIKKLEQVQSQLPETTEMVDAEVIPQEETPVVAEVDVALEEEAEEEIAPVVEEIAPVENVVEEEEAVDPVIVEIPAEEEVIVTTDEAVEEILAVDDVVEGENAEEVEHEEEDHPLVKAYADHEDERTAKVTGSEVDKVTEVTPTTPTPKSMLPKAGGAEIYSPVGEGSDMKIIYFGDDSNEVPALPSDDRNFISPSTKVEGGTNNGW